MNTCLYFIRHGDISNRLHIIYGRVRDISLASKGMVQIQSLGKKISDERKIPEVIYCSPLLRARQSGELLQKFFFGTQLIIREELSEVDTHHFVGRSLDWAYTLENPYLSHLQIQYDYQVESPEFQIMRMQRVVNEALGKYKGKSVLFVSHGDPIAFIVHTLMYPDSPCKTITHLKNDGYYLLRGEAWRIEMNDSRKVVTNTKIFSS